MQKKIVALAVAGLSTAAFAQTNVTIYGVADVSAQGYSLSQSKAPSKANGGAQGNVFSLQSNSSLIGFKGTEDLGNGLKALFQAETSLNMAGTENGNDAGGGVSYGNYHGVFGALRDTYVGVNSKYGTVLGGYVSTPVRAALTSFDVMPGATGSSEITKIMTSMRLNSQDSETGSTTTGLATAIRATAIAYAMPTLYGFDGSIAYTGSNNNGTDNSTNPTNACGAGSSVSACSAAPQSAFSMNLGWTGYGVNIKGAFQQNNNNYTNSSMGDYTTYLVGAAYTGIAGLKVSGVYARNSLGTNGVTSVTANGAGKISNNQFWTGASYRMGNWEPRISAVWSSDLDGSSVQQLGARQWTANVGYYLSKRTQVYGLVSNLNNSANQNYSLGQQSNKLVPTGGQNLFTYGMGLRTTF